MIAGATVFVLAKTLKWWAILTLGPFWTFRVIVVPGVTLVATGPYRWLRHPNYVGVVGELAGAALMTGALVTGPIAAAGFLILLSKRIAVESRMLQSATRRHLTCSFVEPPRVRKARVSSKPAGAATDSARGGTPAVAASDWKTVMI